MRRKRYSIYGLIAVLILLSSWTKKNDVHHWAKEQQQLPDVFQNVIWHWEDHFSSSEKEKLESWLKQTTLAVWQSLGEYPFKIHFFLHRKDNSDEPTPWANTTRHFEQGVHFYVDTSYSLDDFMEDWTAPHEISHLSIPYLGQSNSWFAEGYATYLQCQVMYQMGYFTKTTLEKKYKDKRNQIKEAYDSSKPFIEVAKDLGKRNHYPQMYWGGACFFYELDKRLKKKNMTLNEVIQKYQVCCRMADENDGLEKVIRSWDKIIGEDVASQLLTEFSTTPARQLML